MPAAVVCRTPNRRSDTQHKLVSAAQYRAVLAGSYRTVGKHFLVRALGNALGGARLGLIASRKAAPRAVDRNRGKRLARASFRSAQPELPAVDIVLQQKNNLRDASNRVLRHELDRLIREVAERYRTRDARKVKSGDLGSK